MSDIQNHVERLKSMLSKVQYPEKISLDILTEGNPTCFLRMIHYILIDFSPDYYKGFVEKGYELFSKNDLRFVEQVYKLLVKELNYKPQINISQFLSESFLEHKVILVADLAEQTLKRAPKRIPPKKSMDKENYDFSNSIDDEEIQPMPRPKPYQPKTIQQHSYEQEPICETYIPIHKSEQFSPEPQIQQQQQQYIPQQVQVQQQKIQNPDETPVTQADLQKLMQVILMSNENIKVVMSKFAELQNTVNQSLNNFNQRLSAVEARLSK